MEQVSVGEKTPKKTARLLCCAALFRTPSFRKSVNFCRTSIASLDSETVQLPASSILSAMFTGACGPPEKLSLALVPRSYDQDNILRLTRSYKELKKARSQKRASHGSYYSVSIVNDWTRAPRYFVMNIFLAKRLVKSRRRRAAPRL